MKIHQWNRYNNYQKSTQKIEERYELVQHCLSLALASIAPKGFRRALDIAYGHGDSTRIASRHADAIIGIDSSSELIRVAKEKRPGKKFSFHCTRLKNTSRQRTLT